MRLNNDNKLRQPLYSGVLINLLLKRTPFTYCIFGKICKIIYINIKYIDEFGDKVMYLCRDITTYIVCTLNFLK